MITPPARILLLLALLTASLRAGPGIDFNRDIRPILSEKCFRCHGPDEADRKGGREGLRLDTLIGATEDLGGGAFALVPGRPEHSELLKRVLTTEEDDVMPPTRTGKKVSSTEADLLRRWIAEGGAYARHWSYEPPRRPGVPTVKNAGWARGPVDRFLLARLEQAKLAPQPEADRLTLARRVALDLTGLPPTLAEAEAFVRDPHPDAYGRYVDAQLAKPAFGEHWARLWLDLARYADSKGYADDQPRSIWSYRDWVINAFNRNLPFDQFTVEQIAGDLLPHASEEQRVATGFHRNTMNNTEGGTDDEEFRTVAVVDRVNTTFAVWMGTSMACAQCHTHKYDPITQREYFQAYAILNQTEDADRNDEAPVLEFYTPEQRERRTLLEQEIAAIEARWREASPAHAEAARRWASAWTQSPEWFAPGPRAVKAGTRNAPVIGESGWIRVAAGRKKETIAVDLPAPEGGPLRALRVEVPPGAAGFVVNRVRAAVRPSEPWQRARFVRVELPGANRMLSLAEVEVLDADGRNLARTATARQSSVADGADASRAIDGRTDGLPTAQSLSATQSEDSPWWEVDLQATAALAQVVLWGRTGLDPTSGGLRLKLLDAERNVVWEQVSKDAPRPRRSFALADPVELKVRQVSADYAQAGLDESLVAGDQEAKSPNRRKPGADQRGWGVAGGGDGPHWLALELEQPLQLRAGERLVVTVEQRAEGDGAGLEALRVTVATDPRVGEWLRFPTSVRAALARPDASPPDAELALLQRHYVEAVAPDLAPERRRRSLVRQALDAMPLNTTPVMRELSPDRRRTTHVQLRGNFRSLGEQVSPGVPAAFPSLPAGVEVNRLTFARWLVSRENPLTARVLANRYWEAVFGAGLVRTVEEFGSQGELPSHPELLDWLAVELMDRGWDTKAFLRILVTSAAYRQSSKVTPAALETDPENRLLSRGPRFRMSAEAVRDQALAVAGLLSPVMFGPSVRPFQPSSGLAAAFGGTLDWKPSEGADRFRRGLYTEWRRSSPYPSMATFDAPNREVCTLRRGRTNTPLQALVTLNDPVYVEAAQALAAAVMAEPGSVGEQLRSAFRRVLIRPPAEQELAPLVALYFEARSAFAATPAQAQALAGSSAGTGDPAERAAWTAVANVLLNLDEVLMKR